MLKFFYGKGRALLKRFLFFQPPLLFNIKTIFGTFKKNPILKERTTDSLTQDDLRRKKDIHRNKNRSIFRLKFYLNSLQNFLAFINFYKKLLQEVMLFKRTFLPLLFWHFFIHKHVQSPRTHAQAMITHT